MATSGAGGASPLMQSFVMSNGDYFIKNPGPGPQWQEVNKDGKLKWTFEDVTGTDSVCADDGG